MDTRVIYVDGQTGSGKTFSMLGDENDSNNIKLMGIIPRSISYIINNIKLHNDIMESSILVSFVEIYNETLNDLLNPNNNNKIRIIVNKKGETILQNIETKKVNSVVDVLQLIEIASQYRTKASTKMNATSSRSHMLMIIKLKLKYRSDDGYTIKYGRINFADLAGSEKVNKTGIIIAWIL